MNNFGVLGWPLEKTYSPFIHKSLLNMTQLEGNYELLKIENIDEKNIHDLNKRLDGYNITIPHKENILGLNINSIVDEHAQSIGAINTVKSSGESIEYYNTDYEGFLFFLKKIDYDWKDKNILILGSGGSSKAIRYALSSNSSSTHIASRNVTEDTISYNEAEDIGSEINFLINTTPIGMSHLNNLSLDLDVNKFTNLDLFLNIGYGNTGNFFKPLVDSVNSYNGIGMLICQAILSFNIWTNLNLQVLDIYDELYKLLVNKND